MAADEASALPKYVTLESLRGMAALLVAMFHFNFVVSEKLPIIAQGAIFVDFFFVLSGFVIALAYHDRVKAGFKFRDFVILRLGRLYPLHLFILICWLPYVLAKYFIFTKMGMGSDPTEHNNLLTLLQNVFMLQSFGVHDALTWNGPSWSISAEIFAYLVFFAVVSLLPKLAGKWLFAGISIISFAILIAVSTNDLLRTFDYGFLRCIAGFFAGAALQLTLRNLTWQPTRAVGSLLEIAAFALMLFCVWKMQGSPVMQLASFASFAFVIAVFAQQEAGIISNALRKPWLVYLGTISYSLYMVHSIIAFAAIDFGIYIMKMQVISEPGHGKLIITPWAPLLAIVYLGTIIAVSHFTYRWIEKPFRDRARVIIQKRKAKAEIA